MFQGIGTSTLQNDEAVNVEKHWSKESECHR